MASPCLVTQKCSRLQCAVAAALQLHFRLLLRLLRLLRQLLLMRLHQSGGGPRVRSAPPLLRERLRRACISQYPVAQLQTLQVTRRDG